MDEVATATGYGAWWIGVTAAVTSLVTILCTKGVDAWLRMRQSGLDARQYSDNATLAGYEQLINEQNKRITSLEAQLTEVQSEHLECVKLRERLLGANEKVSREVELLRDEVVSLRQWRHDLADKEHSALLKAAATAAQADKTV